MKKQQFDKKEPELVAIDKLFNNLTEKNINKQNLLTDKQKELANIATSLGLSEELKKITDKQKKLADSIYPNKELKSFIDRQKKLADSIYPNKELKSFIDRQNKFINSIYPKNLKKIIDDISVKHKKLADFLK